MSIETRKKRREKKTQQGSKEFCVPFNLFECFLFKFIFFFSFSVRSYKLFA